MKKAVFVSVACLLSTFLFAQNFSAGVKAGVNITNFTGGDFEAVDKKAMVGFHAGGFLSFALGALYLQPEALISTQGARIDSANGSYDWKVTYAAVPVMLKYRTAGGFFVEAGPQFSFKISDNIENESIHNFVNDLDLSAGFGLGLQTKGGLGIGARYLVGISKVGDFTISEGNGIDPDFKNSVLQVGVSLALGK